MKHRTYSRGFTRRQVLKASGQGALAASLAGGNLLGTAFALPRMDIRQVATDGMFSFPGRRRTNDNGVFGFGFRGVQPAETFADPGTLITKYKFRMQWPAPTLAIPSNIDLYMTMTNLGFEVRPDLDDSHTIHWHGFRNPNSVFDGVPEVSIAVPPGRDFPYFYRPRDAGTYMYHCHFEDTEHVQMGMDGIVYIQPPGTGPLTGKAYTSNVTAFHREFTLLLNDLDQSPHDNLANVQEFLWSDYEADYWLINGRSYPDTIVRDQDLATYVPADDPGAGGDFNYPDPGGLVDADLGYTQPVSSLIQVQEGEIALLRFANLGFEQQSMQLLGPRMLVVGHDAVYLGINRYEASTIYIGPGEARDALVTAPAFDGSLANTATDTDGRDYNYYWLRNRNAHRLVNGTLPGMGGQVTQMWVYPTTAAIGPQSAANVTV